MARDSETGVTGDSGEWRIGAEFSALGWAPVATRRELGTDLFVEVRDSRRFDAGLFIGVQAKSGTSWFESKEFDRGGELVGWWFYEKDVEHFDSWVTHGLPHLVVLYNPKTKLAHWVHVTADKIVPTGNGAKILVPRTQLVDESSRDSLVEAAATQRQRISHEGSIWSGGDRIPPGHVIRYAMIAPRLVAPHRNAGISRVLSAEEALALIIRARIEDIDAYRSKKLCPTADDPGRKAATWLWRFTFAVESVLCGDGTDQLDNLRRNARRRDRRAAAEIFFAAMLMQSEQFDEAIDVLSAAPTDSWEPVDYAWSQVVLAAAQAEVGRIEEARSAATASLRSLSGRSDDPTASAIRGAAASLLFYTASIEEEDVGATLSASDTAVSWWRSQTILGGVSASAHRAYRRIFHDKSKRFGGSSNPGHNRILSAAMTALLAGDWSAYRSVTMEQGINHVIGSDNWREESAASLDCLRRSGNRRELQLQAKHVWAWEDTDTLSSAVKRFEHRKFSHSSANGSIALLEVAGDILECDRADPLIDYFLGVLENPHEFVRRVVPNFSVSAYVARALDGLVRSGSVECRARVGELLCAMRDLGDGLLAHEVPGIVSKLVDDPAVSQMADRFLESATRQEARKLSACMLEVAMSAGSKDALELLLKRSASGDKYALGALGDVRKLRPGDAARFIERDEARLDQIVRQARQGGRTQYSDDPAHSVAILNSWFPEQASWDSLVRFMGAEEVAGSDKRGACFALAHLGDRLPEHVKDNLGKIGPRLTDGDLDFFSDSTLGGAGVYLAASLGQLDEATFAPRLVALLGSGGQRRADAVYIASVMKRPDFQILPVGLLNDSDPDVRAAAATALMHELVRSQEEPSPIIAEALRTLIDSNGCQLPLRVANAVAKTEVPNSSLAHAIVERLSYHRSAVVRSRAKSVKVV